LSGGRPAWRSAAAAALAVLGLSSGAAAVGPATRGAAQCLAERPLPPEPPPARPQTAFGVGERLTFDIKYKFVKAGTSVMEVKEVVTRDGQAAYHVTSRASSNTAFSLIHEVNDRIDSWIERRSLRSLGFEKHLREGRYKRDEVVRFDYREGVAVYGNGREIEIGSEVQDILSAFYFMRTLPLEVGRSLSILSHADGKNYPLEVQVLRQDRISVGAGKFDCYVVEPLLKSSGVFRQKGRLTIWLTRDERHLPVMMKSKISVGSVVAELAEYRPGRVEGTP
jgi:hypothetical protein